MRLLVCAGAAALLLAGCSGDEPSYDEDAHREQIEELIGHPVGDWDGYVSAWRRACLSDEAVFARVVSGEVEEGSEAEIRLNVEQLCPDRVQELEYAIDIMS